MEEQPEVLPVAPVGPPYHVPVSFENIDPDRYYYAVRMADGNQVDFLVFTGHADDWKTQDKLNPELLYTRHFKRVFSIDALTEEGVFGGDYSNNDNDNSYDSDDDLIASDFSEYDGQIMNRFEYDDIIGDNSDKASDAWFALPYALDANGAYVSDGWNDQIQVDGSYMTHPIRRAEIKQAPIPGEIVYIFYKPAAGGRRRRRTLRRHRRTVRRNAVSRRRRYSRRR